MVIDIVLDLPVARAVRLRGETPAESVNEELRHQLLLGAHEFDERLDLGLLWRASERRRGMAPRRWTSRNLLDMEMLAAAEGLTHDRLIFDPGGPPDAEILAHVLVAEWYARCLEGCDTTEDYINDVPYYPALAVEMRVRDAMLGLLRAGWGTDRALSAVLADAVAVIGDIPPGPYAAERLVSVVRRRVDRLAAGLGGMRPAWDQQAGVPIPPAAMTAMDAGDAERAGGIIRAFLMRYLPATLDVVMTD